MLLGVTVSATQDVAFRKEELLSLQSVLDLRETQLTVVVGMGQITYVATCRPKLRLSKRNQRGCDPRVESSMTWSVSALLCLLVIGLEQVLEVEQTMKSQLAMHVASCAAQINEIQVEPFRFCVVTRVIEGEKRTTRG